MKTHLRQLGNSKAVLLPSAVLAESGLSGDIEMTVEVGRIILTAANTCREGWYDAYLPSLEADANGLLDALDLDVSTEEWEW
jgi:antitoxin MazE